MLAVKILVVALSLILQAKIFPDKVPSPSADPLWLATDHPEAVLAERAALAHGLLPAPAIAKSSPGQENSQAGLTQETNGDDRHSPAPAVAKNPQVIGALDASADSAPTALPVACGLANPVETRTTSDSQVTDPPGPAFNGALP